MPTIPRLRILLILCCVTPFGFAGGRSGNEDLSQAISSHGENFIFDEPGLTFEYRIDKTGAIPVSNVLTFSLHAGSQESIEGAPYQWLQLRAMKQNGTTFSVWILSNRYPATTVGETKPSIARYLLQEENGPAVEYRHRFTSEAVLPVLGAWEHLIPRSLDDDSSHPVGKRMRYLGHPYSLVQKTKSEPNAVPENPIVLDLLPDVMIGKPHNTKPVDSARRYDDSDYEYIRLSKADYDEMIQAGMNCLRVDSEQAGWIEYRPVYYWGVGGNDLQYPEHLYRSNYLGPVLFLDEPGVCARDYVLRPRLREEPEFRKTITPQHCFEEFKKYFAEANTIKNPSALMQILSGRPDIDPGDMRFLQQNLYTWETLVSTALHQLATDRTGPPSAIVFEPPGRVGAKRTLPEMNMAYNCQIPITGPNHLIDIIYGFLRGAARATEKSWGTSIYGSVDRDDAVWYLTHAYDLGAQWFLFWDTHRLACVPHDECLALSRHLSNHVANHPHRDIERLKRSAEVAILFPAGYNLGHVHMGRGNLWGLGELNLERANRYGVAYRAVMGNFFTEIERCLRLGVAFDLFWDLPSFQPEGYREIVRILENGTVEVTANGNPAILDGPRIPCRPEGGPPQLTVEISPPTGKAPLLITARASIVEGSSRIFYTSGTNQKGIYVNSKILWELYGPEEEDYQTLSHEFKETSIDNQPCGGVVEIEFTIDRPGSYRLRASTCDMAGRTTVNWTTIDASE